MLRARICSVKLSDCSRLAQRGVASAGASGRRSWARVTAAKRQLLMKSAATPTNWVWCMDSPVSTDELARGAAPLLRVLYTLRRPQHTHPKRQGAAPWFSLRREIGRVKIHL